MALRVLVATTLTLAALAAQADQADEIARLRQEAAALRQSLEKLEAEIQALEAGKPAAVMPEKPVESSPVSVHRSWSQVQPGVSKEEVGVLLGKPERVMRINGDLVWYYVYPGLGRGSVFFNGEDKVTGTQAPRAGWFQ